MSIKTLALSRWYSFCMKSLEKNDYHNVFGVQDQRFLKLLAMTLEIKKMLRLKMTLDIFIVETPVLNNQQMTR